MKKQKSVPVIDSYSFANIVIDGTRYTSDVIIYPFGVDSRWWRKEGHVLSVDDLENVLKQRPDVLVVGSGTEGLMNVLHETREYIISQNIRLIVENTEKACEIYNSRAQLERVVAALHLTC